MTDNAENSTTTTAENEQPKSGGDKGSATPEAKFTQADIDRIAGDTRKSAKEKAIADFLKDLGLDNVEDVKARIVAAKAKEDADKSEAQKASDRADAADKKRQEVEQRLATYEAERLIGKRDDKITDAAKVAGCTEPTDIIAWAERNEPTALKALMTDDGTVDDKAVAKLIEAARKARPAWFRPATPGSPTTRDGYAPQAGRDARQSDEAATARALRGRVG